MKTSSSEVEISSAIAAANDRFRGSAADVYYTSGVRDGIMDLIGLSIAIEQFNSFTEDNDPYGEHDFGSLEFEHHKIFWKMDFYDTQLRHWCDPLSRG